MQQDIAILTVQETAKLLKISERALARLIAERTLPSLKLGRRRLIREVALKAYLERHETVAR